MGELSGKTALVTGASRGIGRAIALTLAGAGARVGVHYAKARGAADEVAALIGKSGGEAFVLGADLSDFAALEPFSDAVKAQGPLDILVNNAGLFGADGLDVSERDYDAMMDLNVKANFFLTRQLAPHINDGGRIILLSSGLSLLVAPDRIVYGATKAALNSMTRDFAQALSPRRINVNAILPDVIETDMTAKMIGDGRRAAMEATGMRIGVPQDIADVALFLASYQSRWVTGQLIGANGGRG